MFGEKDNLVVKFINPEELPLNLIINLTKEHKISLPQFVVMYESKNDTLYINKNIQEEDAEKFVEVVKYSEECLSSGLIETLDDIDARYGWENYHIISNAWRQRRDQRKKVQAVAEAKKICKVIERLIDEDFNNEDSDVKTIPSLFSDNEHLLYELYCMGEARKGYSTVMDYGDKYTFIYAYLLGKGEIGPDWQQEVDA